jgi:DNA-binding XRE family transcriptional regulator
MAHARAMRALRSNLDIAPPFTVMLRAARALTRLSQAEVAEAAGISIPTLKRAEADGPKSPTTQLQPLPGPSKRLALSSSRKMVAARG